MFNLPERREIKKIAKSKPVEHGLPFSTWSLSKLADFLVAEGVVDDISYGACGSCFVTKAFVSDPASGAVRSKGNYTAVADGGRGERHDQPGPADRRGLELPHCCRGPAVRTLDRPPDSAGDRRRVECFVSIFEPS